MKRFARVLLSILFVICFFCFLAAVLYFRYEFKKIKKINRSYVSYISNMQKSQGPMNGRFGLPKELKNIPFGDKSGLVLGSKTIEIRNVFAPYNPSIIKKDNGYLIFFRYDIPLYGKKVPIHSFIGCAELDRKFNQTEKEYVRINTGTNTSEDPRAIKVGDEIYLIYNDTDYEGSRFRTMRIAGLDPKSYKILFITPLSLQLNHVEKNWAPFDYAGLNEDSSIYFEYSLSPHKIIKLVNPKENVLENCAYPNKAVFQKLNWKKSWGILRGGTPPINCGDYFLGFFHSSFKDSNGFIWYLMGAYTFDSNPPFKLKRMSYYPILFNGIYGSSPVNTSDLCKRVIFPSGFLEEKVDGQNLLHIACGENDCAIKVVTLDKNKLLKSMIKI